MTAYIAQCPASPPRSKTFPSSRRIDNCADCVIGESATGKITIPSVGFFEASKLQESTSSAAIRTSHSDRQVGYTHSDALELAGRHEVVPIRIPSLHHSIQFQSPSVLLGGARWTATSTAPSLDTGSKHIMSNPKNKLPTDLILFCLHNI